jgi:cell division protein FtsI/penicillin-binding protein 2
VSDIKTGEILAIAANPDFDPNEHGKYPAALLRLIPVTDMFEPGSTFKLITASAGIEEGLFDLDTVIEIKDFLPFAGGKPIKNSHRVKRDKPFFTLRDVIARSLNTGTAPIGIKLGAKRFYKNIMAFGFGRLTGINFPGEQKGLVHKPEKWRERDVATITFGQSIAATPLQILFAIASIGNHGKLMRPKIVRRIESPDKDIVKSDDSQEVGRTISEKTASKVIELMRGAVYMKGSSGHFARMARYTAGGKTGTAQKPVPGGFSETDFIASFVGIAPTSNPRIAVFVAMDVPKTSEWGELVAAPAFKNITEFTLNYLNVPPDM